MSNKVGGLGVGTPSASGRRRLAPGQRCRYHLAMNPHSACFPTCFRDHPGVLGAAARRGYCSTEDNGGLQAGNTGPMVASACELKVEPF